MASERAWCEAEEKAAVHLVSVRDICASLNRMLAEDPDAMRRLCLERVPCNEALAHDPVAQVHSETPNGPFSIGLIGVLNGLIGITDAGWGPIAAIIEDGGTVVSFRPGPEFFGTAEEE